MSPRTVAVVGAHGKTGRAVTAALRAHGAEVRGIGRAEMGDLPVVLRGCDAVYLIAPNMYEDEPGFVAQVLAASTSAGVTQIGYHSVASPYAPAMPHHLGKAVAEDLVRRGALAWTILQPCAYVANFVPALRSASPTLEVAYSPDRRFGFVDLDDVAEAAALVLLDGRHQGATYELGGPALVSVRDLSIAASAVLGREVPVDRLSVEEWSTRHGSGQTERARRWLLAMFDYYDRHGLPAGSLTLEALLGRPAMSVRDVLRRELNDLAGPQSVIAD